MRIARLLAAASAATVLAVLTASPALAHNSLTKAVPDREATLTERPDRVSLSFLQKVDPDLLTIVVTDAQKNKVPLDAVADGKVATATFSAPLLNGVYTVAYRVVSQDGHPVQGSYRFTLDDPGATPPSAPATTSATSAAPEPSPSAVVFESSSSATDDGLGRGPIAGIIAVVAVLIGGVLVALRRRKSQ